MIRKYFPQEPCCWPGPRQRSETTEKGILELGERGHTSSRHVWSFASWLLTPTHRGSATPLLWTTADSRYDLITVLQTKDSESSSNQIAYPAGGLDEKERALHQRVSTEVESRMRLSRYCGANAQEHRLPRRAFDGCGCLPSHGRSHVEPWQQLRVSRDEEREHDQ